MTAALLALPLALIQNPLQSRLQSECPVPGAPLFGADAGLTLSNNTTPPLGQRTPGAAGSFVVEISAAGENGYSTELKSPASVAPIRKGDVLIAALDIRSLAGGRESGEGRLMFGFQQNSAPWGGLTYVDATVTRSRRVMYFTTTAQQDFPAGTVEATLHIAQQAQRLEVFGFAALNLGQGVDPNLLPFTRITYPGMEPDAPWRAKAWEMLDKNRKSDLAIEVVRGGQPVPGAQIEVVQESSSYPFATFLDADPNAPGEDSPRYRAALLELFNAVTVPIYWADWGWNEGPLKEDYRSRIDWAKQNNLRMKAHCLLWPSFRWMPTRVRELENSPAALRSLVTREARARAAAIAAEPFAVVDVLNELKTEQELGGIVGFDIYEEVFGIARQAWPQAKLVYNDFNIVSGGGADTAAQNEVKRWLRHLQAAKAPLDMIGFQAHFGEGLTSPERIWEVLDDFHGEFGLPIEATEFDVGTRDEEAQAAYTRDFLLAWYAHPATAGFTKWGFWEGAHWKPNGAMFRRDWSPKPNLAAYKEMVLEKFRTRESLTANGSGRASLRAFHGRHRVTVRIGGAQAEAVISLGAESGRVRIELPAEPRLR